MDRYPRRLIFPARFSAFKSDNEISISFTNRFCLFARDFECDDVDAFRTERRSDAKQHQQQQQQHHNIGLTLQYV